MAMTRFPTVPADPPPWAVPSLLRPPPLKGSVDTDVVVVGDTVAGCQVAAKLAEEGAKVSILGQDVVFGLATCVRGDGLVHSELQDNMERLQASLGPQVAGELLVWCQRGAAALGCGTDLLIAAAGEAESGELQRSLDIRAECGLPGKWLDGVTLESRWGLKGLYGGYLAAGGAIDPLAPLRDALTRAQSLGVLAYADSPVLQANRLGARHQLNTAQGTITADMVVLCGDYRLSTAWPWLADKLSPVRLQNQLRPHASLGVAVSAQFGYLTAAPGMHGLVLGGCRWATPHMETGEDSPDEIRSTIDAKIASSWVSRMSLDLGPVGARWSRIATWTCDGLPIIGPIPGSPTVVACLGFNGRPWMHTPPAVDTVVQGILDGRAFGLPTCLHPGRFVG